MSWVSTSRVTWTRFEWLQSRVAERREMLIHQRRLWLEAKRRDLWPASKRPRPPVASR